MANEVSCNINYSFLSEDGTVYARDVTFDVDDGQTASRPKRYRIKTDANGTDTLLFSSTPSFATQLTGAAFALIVNRDQSDRVRVSTMNVDSDVGHFWLNPNEWAMINIAESTVTSGGFTVAMKPLDDIVTYSEEMGKAVEIFTIYKATS